MASAKLAMSAVAAASGNALAQTTSPAATTLAIPTVQTAPPLDPKAESATWKDAANVTLPWDVQHQKVSSEPTAAYIATDGTNIYVRFDVKQRETLLGQQRTNDVGDGTDDEVWVDLWPNGNNGFYYQFAANSNGTRWQYSSENTAYSPTWTSFGAASGNDYTVTMKIPIKVMRGSGGGSQWKVQFVRIIRSTGERQIWTYGPTQTNGDDVIYAGVLSGMAPAVASRAKPRVALYGLGIAGSGKSGLTTSRMGADFSVPVTSTSSIYGTLHPDFSNVETDQQTISPTAYQRSFNEVRPFFTQGANFYDNFSCDACPFVAQLYTPAIPTPREGFAFEGKQGQFSFAGFNAIGDHRNDGAANVAWRSNDNHWRVSAQSVAANLPGLTDHVATTGVSWQDNSHVQAYFDYGSDSGTNILPQTRRSGTTAACTTTPTRSASRRRRARSAGTTSRSTVSCSMPTSRVTRSTKTRFGCSTRSRGSTASSSPRSSTATTRRTARSTRPTTTCSDILTQSRIDVQLNSGSSYLLLDSGVFTPISQNGIGVTWHSGTFNSPGSNGFHGSSATPTSFSYNTGRFGPGRVDTWFRSSTMRVGSRGTLSLEADDTRGYEDNGTTNVQWLERAGYAYATGANSSLALGMRRIIGTPPIVDVRSLPGYTGAWNVTFAFHHRTPHDELYFAYGDASRLSTLPQFVLKLIHYFGAEKGT